MALQIFEKEYPLDGGASQTAGYGALAADMENWLDWDEIDSETTENETVFKKFQPGSQTHWCGIRVTHPTSGQFAATVSPVVQGVSQFQFPVLTGNAASAAKYTVCAVNEKGFVLMAGGSPFPSASINSFHAVGIYPCQNRITGKEGFCSFGGSCNGFFIGGESAVSSSVSSFYTAKPTQSGLTAALPLLSECCADVPEDLLFMPLLPDTFYGCSMSVTFNNKNYRRLGCILIPE